MNGLRERTQKGVHKKPASGGKLPKSGTRKAAKGCRETGGTSGQGMREGEAVGGSTAEWGRGGRLNASSLPNWDGNCCRPQHLTEIQKKVPPGKVEACPESAHRRK